jgi:hypothetical protein
VSVDAYDLSDDVNLPLQVAAVLRAEPWLLGFFGADGIRAHDDSDVAAWTPRPPYLAVLPGTMRETRAAGEVLRVAISVRVRIYLQTAIPTAAWITSPMPPTVTVNGAGVLTGVRRYAVTAWDGSGESSVHDSTGIVMTSGAVTYVAQKGSLVMPTVAGVTGLRLWATKLGGTALYFHSLAASGATVEDNKPDSALSLEMAPIRFLGQRLVSACKRALIAREGMNGKAFAAMAFEDVDPRAENGVRAHEFRALIPARLSVVTRESTV